MLKLGALSQGGQDGSQANCRIQRTVANRTQKCVRIVDDKAAGLKAGKVRKLAKDARSRMVFEMFVLVVSAVGTWK